MSEALVVSFTRCEHGVWQGHNATVSDDGTVERTEPCDGGLAVVGDDVFANRRRIPPILDTILRGWLGEPA